MNLKTYLKRTKRSQSEFAGKLGVTQGLVSQWVKGVTTITPERAIDIEGATEGMVTRYDLRPDIFGRAPQSPKETTVAAA